MNTEKASVREKICYGIGGMSYMIELSVMLSFLTIFCSDVMRMDITILGIVISATKILDAISDILITNVADKIQTRWGKYRLWFFMSIPLGICLMLSFFYPSFLTTETQKTIWVCFIYVLTVPVFETTVTAPVIVLNTTLSADYQDRTHFSLARALGEAAGQIITSYGCMTIVLAFGAYKNVTGWRVMAIVMGILVMVTGLIGFFGTKERVIISNRSENGTQLTLLEKLKLLKSNKPFWKDVIMLIGFMVQYYGSMAMFPYFCIHVLGHEEWHAPLASVGFMVQTAAVLSIFLLTRFMEKRSIAILGGLSLIIATVFLIFARGYLFVLFYQIFFGIGNGFLNTITFSVMPDICDYGEWKTGNAIPGTYSAIATFGMKISGAGATLFLTQVLARSGYDAAAQAQTASVTTAIHAAYVIMSLVAACVATAAAFSMKEISRNKVAVYKDEIYTRKSGDTSAIPTN